MSDMAEVFPKVWVGGWSAARDHGHEFDFVANVASDAPHTTAGALWFPMVDGPGNAPEVMRAAVAFVTDAIRGQRKILVHCVGGHSRSVTVVAAALRNVYGTPIAETVEHIRPIRALQPDQPHMALLALVG